FARCVYRSDNNVVDHQSVLMQFTGGVTAVLDMHAFAQNTYRETKIVGTKGEIVAKFGETCSITVNSFTPVDTFCARTYSVPVGASGHGGGDQGIANSFISYLFEGKNSKHISSLEVSVASHKMAFAAEKSRLNHGIPVSLK
ncbi:MAG: gfo/Idh/MocA family oxidoreductase, partial [Clostridia bacterium]|nr:gfo/Idh/MocA family oxidoreductase [Clostridia bacterium]